MYQVADSPATPNIPRTQISTVKTLLITTIGLIFLWTLGLAFAVALDAL
jgi:hypothetical protein